MRFRGDTPNFSGLIEIIKDSGKVVQVIESIYPDIKPLWMKYKGHKLIFMPGLTELLNVPKNRPHLTTDMIEERLAHTGIVCISSTEEVNELLRNNEGNPYLSKLLSTFRRKSVPYVRLFPPASALLVLMTGDDIRSRRLRERLRIKLPPNMGSTALLGAINRALVHNKISKESFYLYDSQKNLLNKVGSRREKVSKGGKDDKELLAQPREKTIKTGKVINSKAFYQTHSTILQADLDLSMKLMEGVKERIALLEKSLDELREELLQHESDYYNILNQKEAVEKVIGLIGSVDIPLSGILLE